MPDRDPIRAAHDREAPAWALALVLLLGVGLSTTWIEGGPFWRGYVLDMTGPAWTYILFRLRYTRWSDSAWTRFFNPARTVVLALGSCVLIEGAQYLEWYDATFDPWDFLAYAGLLIPAHLADRASIRRARAGAR